MGNKLYLRMIFICVRLTRLDLHDCHTMTLKQRLLLYRDIFIDRCLHIILRFWWTNYINNQEQRRQTDQIRPPLQILERNGLGSDMHV